MSAIEVFTYDEAADRSFSTIPLDGARTRDAAAQLVGDLRVHPDAVEAIIQRRVLDVSAVGEDFRPSVHMSILVDWDGVRRDIQSAAGLLGRWG